MTSLLANSSLPLQEFSRLDVGASAAQQDVSVPTASPDGPITAKVRYSRAPKSNAELWLKAEDVSTNLEWVDVPVEVHDARPLIGKTSIDKEGFEILVADSKVPSWEDEAAIKSTFFPEAVDLVKSITGAKHAFVFDHTFRRVDNSVPGRPPGRQTVGMVHVDYSNASALKRLRDFFGDRVADSPGRFGIVNVWRPVVPVVYDKPLGFIDATTVEEKDLSMYKLILKDRVGENQTVHPNEPSHKWYYIPRQRGNEVYIFKQFDSDETKTKWTPHAGFDDPTVPAEGGFQKRESIELRVFVFYEEDEQEIEALKNGG